MKAKGGKTKSLVTKPSVNQDYSQQLKDLGNKEVGNQRIKIPNYDQRKEGMVETKTDVTSQNMQSSKLKTICLEEERKEIKK